MNETDRYFFSKAEAAYLRQFGGKPSAKWIKSNGRLEIIGNHTDHQLGHCLVASATLSLRAAIGPDSVLVSILSEGYPPFTFPSNDLAKKESEAGRPIGLTRGVMHYLREAGYKVGGFRAALIGNVASGSGVSSSAAYELFVAEAMNALYNDGKIPPLVMAKAGQFAENVYFGKASGILDQTGSAFGGLSYMDLTKGEPEVTSIVWPFEDEVKIYLVNPHSSHAGLGSLYDAMPGDMKKVAALFGKKVLSEVDEAAFYEKANGLALPEKVVDRARHFFYEERQVKLAKRALEERNLDFFLTLERMTELSQEKLLRNVMIDPSRYASSPLEAVEVARSATLRSAHRVMGGGLAGNTINFVVKEEEEAFKKAIGSRYGEDSVIEVGISPLGATEVEKETI